MLYIDSDKKNLINKNDYVLIGSGNFGQVFRKDDKCIKTFYSDIPRRTKEVLTLIKQINDPYLYKIYGFLYDTFDDEFSGYIMKYYDRIKSNLLTMNPEYIKHSYYELMRLSDLLSNKGILMYDSYGSNCIMTDNGIVLIDCDNYKIGENPDYIKFSNRIAIYELLIGVLLKEFKELKKIEDINVNEFRLYDKFNELVHRDISNLNEKVIDYIKK